MQSRVRQIALRLRMPADLADRAERLRTQIERGIVVRVLEELERRVHARFGRDAVLRVRSLTLAWRLDAREIGDESLVSRLAADLADHLEARIESLPGPERLRPRDDDIALFEDPCHARAALLADAAEGRGATWIHSARTADEAWRETLAGGGDDVRAVLGWIARMDAARAVLAAAPPAVRAELQRALPRASWPAPVAAALRAIEHRELGEPDADPEAARRAPTGVSAHGSIAAPRESVRRGARDPRAERVSHVAASEDGAAPVATPGEPDAGAFGADVGVAADDYVEAATAHAGLFYLAAGVMEIGLAERLWAAGLPEGDVLAHACAAIAGTNADDPAPRWFGGVFDGEPETPLVAPWAGQEVREQTMHRLGTWLARRGSDTTPDELDAALDALAASFSPATSLPRELEHLVRRAAASITTWVAARMFVAPEASVVRGVCARPGTLRLDDERLVVTVPARYLDIELRRAGLDCDPGHLPWLGRGVSLVFEGLEEL